MSRRRVSSETGFALVLVLLLMVLCGTLVAGAAWSSAADIRIASAFARGLEADHAAQAGIARAIVDLGGLPDFTAVLDGSARSTFVDGPPAGVRTIPGRAFVDLDLEVSLATCGVPPPCTDARRVTVTQARPWGPNNPRWRLFAYGPLAALVPASGRAPSLYVVVLAADDPAESDGNPDRDEAGGAPGANVIRLRAEAFGPAGSHRTVQAVVARASPGAPLRVLGWSRGT